MYLISFHIQSARIDILQMIYRTSTLLLFYIAIDIGWGNRGDDENNNQEEVNALLDSPSKDHSVESNCHVQSKVNCQLSIVNYKERCMEESRVILLAYNERVVCNVFLAYEQTNTTIREFYALPNGIVRQTVMFS